MKALFNHHLPFMLAHGGAQVQMERTMEALRQVGVETEPLRWWDDKQTGDVLHQFVRVPIEVLRFAHQKGMKVVFTDYLTQQGSRSLLQRKLHKWIRILMSRTMPWSMLAAHNWDSYLEADACLVSTAWEAHIMADVFATPPAKIHVVPNGVEEVFLNSQPVARGPWLVCTAVITWRKRLVELAQAAVAAKTPLWVIGKPYSDADPYFQRFLALANANATIIRYEGPVMDRAKLAQIYREARGFVLLSSFESLSLSAGEAAACQCPLLLSDLPWARTAFKDLASYCPLNSPATEAAVLKRFYEAAPTLPLPPKQMSWIEVGHQIKGIYEQVLQPGARPPGAA
jgi:glycosyltransferase involved in cell wall biosynthesis